MTPDSVDVFVADGYCGTARVVLGVPPSESVEAALIEDLAASVRPARAETAEELTEHPMVTGKRA